MKKNKGFTLVELMVVIVIIGILAALAIPRFLGATNKTKAAEFKPVLKQLYTLQEAYRQEHDAYYYISGGDATMIGFDTPKNNRFDYTTATAAIASNATGVLGLATPNAQGQLIKRPGGTALSASDIGCVLTDAKLYAVAALEELASTGNTGTCN